MAKPRRSASLIETSPFRHPTAPSTDKAGDKAGEKFGPYIVYEQLGEGGMAYVHRAEMLGAEGFRKTVALKRMRTATSEDPDFVTSFIHEGQLAGRLRHPNIAQAYELGKIAGVYYIAMEFVPGPTLAQILAQSRRAAGALPLPIVLEILIQLCDALDHAHDLRDDGGRPVGLVHRDVSPMNIIVSRAGIAKLIDFGIAKQRGSSLVTQAGVIKGKHAYVAPEYVAGTGFDRRVDLWGLGVVAHEMITGRRLFLGDNDGETIRNVRQMVIPPPSRIAANISPELDDIIMTALSRDPELRWQNAGAMRAALTAEARRQRAVISGAQIRDWIEWAFRQPTREDSPIGQLLNKLEPSISLQMHDIEHVAAASGDGSDDVPTVDKVKPPRPYTDAPDKIVISRDVLPSSAIPRLATRGTPNPRAATPIHFARSQSSIPSLGATRARMSSPGIPEPVEPETSVPITRPIPRAVTPPARLPRGTTPPPQAPERLPRATTTPPRPPPPVPAAGQSPRAAALAEMQRAATAHARAATPLPPGLDGSRVILPRSPSDLDEVLFDGAPSEHDVTAPRSRHAPSEHDVTAPRSRHTPQPSAPVREPKPRATGRGGPASIAPFSERVTPRLRLAVPPDARRPASPACVELEVTPDPASTRPVTHLPADAIPQVVVHVVTSKVAPLATPRARSPRPRWNPPTRWTRDQKPRRRHLPQFIVLLMLAAFAVMCVELDWIDVERWGAILADYV